MGENVIIKVEIEEGGQKESEFWVLVWIVKKVGFLEFLEKEKLLKGYIWVLVEICLFKMLVNDC